MIREIIRPQYTNLTITIPTEYIDRDIELILFPLDANATQENSKTGERKKSLRGVFQEYADKSKRAMEEDAWKNHIVEQYKHND